MASIGLPYLDVASGSRIDQSYFDLMHSYRNAANYLTVGQIYLQDNSFLTELLRPEHKFSTPGGVPSHVGVPTPGSIHEGGNQAIIRANLEDMPEIRQWAWTD